MRDEDPEKIEQMERRGDKKKNTRDLIAGKADDFYKSKAEFDAKRDMMNEPYDPTAGKTRGKKLLDRLLKKKA